MKRPTVCLPSQLVSDWGEAYWTARDLGPPGVEMRRFARARPAPRVPQLTSPTEPSRDVSGLVSQFSIGEIDREELVAALKTRIDHEVSEILSIQVEEPREQERYSKRVAVKNFVAGVAVCAAIFFSSFYPSPDRPVLLEHGSAPPAAYGD